MGIVLGYISFLCGVLLLLKAVTRKLKWKKLDRILMRGHKWLCVAMVVTCLAHIVYVIPVMANRSKGVKITGAIAVLLIIAIIVFCHAVKKKEKNLRWHRILSAAMMLVVIWHIVVSIMDFKDYQTKVSNIQIQGIDASGVADGTYIGKYDVGYIRAEVEVTVENEKITNIALVQHENEKGKLAEKVVEEIIKEQRTDVDEVTGATNSSKVIKKAVEEALQN